MVKVEVKATTVQGMECFSVSVNGSELCERLNHRYANDKAKAFARRLASAGHDVSVKLYEPKHFYKAA